MTRAEHRLWAHRRLKRLELENALLTAAFEAGVARTAWPDVLNRGLEVFTLEDGRVVPEDPTLYSATRPHERRGPREWLEGLREDAKHLFERRTR